MSELVERYVHQVGRYLPKQERADIDAELRSLIQDQLDDRFDGAPAPADVAAVLTELGSPRQMAASYTREQYLVGPDLYPFMMLILRRVWVVIPTIVLFLNLFGAIVAAQIGLDWFVATLSAIVQTTLVFSAVVVFIFALIERVVAEGEIQEPVFNPLGLPKVDDPRTVDRNEATGGLVVGAFFTLVLLYFVHVGGFTLSFNLSDPGDVTPVPTVWLVFMIALVIAMLIVNLWGLRRNRWNVALWLTETVFEVFGMICLYFVIYTPLLARILAAVPTLSNVPAMQQLPEILVILGAITTLASRGSRLVALWSYRDTTPIKSA